MGLVWFQFRTSSWIFVYCLFYREFWPSLSMGKCGYVSLTHCCSLSLFFFLFKIVRTIWPSLSSGKLLLIFIWVIDYWLCNIQYFNHWMGRISWFPAHPCAVYLEISHWLMMSCDLCVTIMWHHMSPGWQLCGQEKLPILLPLSGHHHCVVTLCHGVQRGSGCRR